jgi:hypothetical protein
MTDVKVNGLIVWNEKSDKRLIIVNLKSLLLFAAVDVMVIELTHRNNRIESL